MSSGRQDTRILRQALSWAAALVAIAGGQRVVPAEAQQADSARTVTVNVRIKARRDVPQKVEALIEFWAADLHAQVLRRIAGLRE